MRIIIVDDESNALHIFLDEIMQHTDLEYKFFKDDPAAIFDYVRDKRIDAAFLDIRMPNIDGTELAEKLIKLCNGIKIVFITGLNYTKKDLPADIREDTLGFIYKPYDKNELINCLNEIANVTLYLTVTMFDVFDCKVNGRPIEFSSAKSAELFALLMAYRGKTLTMTDAISQIWPDHDIEKAKILYRDAVWRLRKALQKINFNCVVTAHGKLNLNTENIICDYWDYLEGKKSAYHGNFLNCYDWSVRYLAELDKTE